MMTPRKARLQEINSELAKVNARQQELVRERIKLEREQFKEDHPCPCVRLNVDIEIYDMGEQARRNRVALELGTVCDTHSARKDCKQCGGTGKPIPEHNHMGEMFMPDTCPACRLLQRNID